MYKFSGFRDGHTHPLFAEREGVGPDVTDCDTVSAVVERIGDFLKANPECTWVDCGSFSPELHAGQPAHFSQLDEASVAVPIVVHASDHHSIWVNSAALAVAGLTDAAPAIPNAEIVVDATGKPTGVLREWDAMNLIYAHQPAPSLDDDLAALARAQQRLLKAGVVAVQEAWIDPGMPEVYLAAAEASRLLLRVNLAPRIAPQSWREDLNFAKATRSRVRASGSGLLTCNTVKIFVDGVLSDGTALLKHDYCHGGRGTALWDPSELAEAALAADSAGFQLHFHAIGDAAVAAALDALDHVDLCNGFVDRRSVISHAELIDPADYARIKRLGTIVCQQPAWASVESAPPSVATALGDDRVERLYPLRDLLDNRVALSFGSDWPVSPPEPLPAIFTACTRLQPGSNSAPLNAGQSIGRTEALRAYSVGTALQLGQESLLSQDEVTFDTDLENCTNAELLGAKVVSVRVAGRVVYEA
ncbi:MAG: amidohydrolase family protein [Actinomycetales bacterium]|nr:amidohydrolase family protein [Actinomycetales bacterium]